MNKTEKYTSVQQQQAASQPAKVTSIILWVQNGFFFFFFQNKKCLYALNSCANEYTMWNSTSPSMVQFPHTYTSIDRGRRIKLQFQFLSWQLKKLENLKVTVSAGSVGGGQWYLMEIRSHNDTHTHAAHAHARIHAHTSKPTTYKKEHKHTINI